MIICRGHLDMIRDCVIPKAGAYTKLKAYVYALLSCASCSSNLPAPRDERLLTVDDYPIVAEIFKLGFWTLWLMRSSGPVIH